MDIELEGLQLMSSGYAKLFSSSGDKWLCGDNSTTKLSSCNVTLMMREDQLSDPISCWVYNPNFNRISFKPGEKVEIFFLCKWSVPAIYYPKNPEQRKRVFTKFNLRRTFFVHGRDVSDPESNLIFKYECGQNTTECSVTVTHKYDATVSGKIRVFSWDLRYSLDLNINQKNALKTENVPYGLSIIYLEKVASIHKFDSTIVAANTSQAVPVVPPRPSIPISVPTLTRSVSSSSHKTPMSIVSESMFASSAPGNSSLMFASTCTFDSNTSKSVYGVDFTRKDTSVHEHELVRYLKSNPASGDVKLVAADGNSVETHRLLLEARSKLLVAENVTKAPVTEIKVPVTSKQVIEEFVNFMIHDSVRDMQSNCLDLFELACKYDVVPLRELCEKHFETFKVTGETADRVARLLKKYRQISSQSLLKAFATYQSQKGEFKDIPTSIVEDLATACDEFCDVILKSRDGKEIPCPSFLLLCRSKVIKKTLLNEMRWLPGQRTPYSMTEFDGDVLTEFVHFLKTDRVRNMKTHALQLLLLADTNRVSKLAVDCIEYITSHIDEFDRYDVVEISEKVSSASKLAQAVQQTF